MAMATGELASGEWRGESRVVSLRPVSLPKFSNFHSVKIFGFFMCIVYYNWVMVMIYHNNLHSYFVQIIKGFEN